MSKKNNQTPAPPEESAGQVPAHTAEPTAADTPAPAPEGAASDPAATDSSAPETPPAASIEAFLPTDYYSPDDAARLRKRRRIAILLAVLALLIALGAAAAAYWNRLNKDPSGFFPSAAPASPTPTQAAGVPATPSPTPDPYALLEQQADLSMMDDIVNVMLIGVDYAEERERWSGKDGLSAAHADVMIVLAVNFDNNTASLISLPRDTYTTVPGVSGIYKLNAALDCGGGLLAENGAGFEKVCETASFLLGGIPIDYYYAVTMPAVKELVDAIGGVDYRLEISFTMQGRSYGAGQRHMNGQAVLDYLRVRKTSSGLEPGQTGDAQRVKRQKKMLVAIFNQLKKKNMMLKVPDILSAFEGQLFTNCSTSQTAALALYGYNMPSDNIGMYSMSGRMRSLYSWNFSFINQNKRIELIKQIYGVDVPVIREITEGYAANVYHTKLANQYINTCSPLTKYVSALIAADNLLPEFTMTPSPSPLPSETPTATPVETPTATPTDGPPTDPPTPPPAAADTPSATDGDTTPVIAPDTPQTPQKTPPAPSATDPVETIPVAPPEGVLGMPGSAAPDVAAALADRANTVRMEETRKYSQAQRNVYKKYLEALDRCKSLRGGSSVADANALASACATLKSAAIRCASTFNYKEKLTWTIPPLANTNEIYVDFR